MIRLSIAVALATCATPALAQVPAKPDVPPASKILANVGFVGSECARYDDRTDDYIVSNLGGDGKGGFLSRVSPDGTVTQLKWVEDGRGGATLTRPLGLFIKGDLVYVADPNAIHMFDRETGKPRGSVAVPDAIRLNDLTVADDGTIFISDSGSDDRPGALFAISAGGGVSVLAARNDALERPNGIALLADGSIVHGGRGVNLVFRDRQGRIVRERTLPTGQIDGIIPLPGGDLLAASQNGKVVYRVPVQGPARIVAEDIAVPAGIGWDAKRNRLLVPQIRAASLGFYELVE